jgi:hypothetical protein
MIFHSRLLLTQTYIVTVASLTDHYTSDSRRQVSQRDRCRFGLHELPVRKCRVKLRIWLVQALVM